MDAVSIIKAEHRNLGAVLFTLEQLVADVDQRDVVVAHKIFHGLLYYIDSFLDKYHHPKETEFLFPIVGRHCADAMPIIEELEHQHKHGEKLLSDVLKTLSAYEFLGESGFRAFRDSVFQYVDFERKHALTEEREILPLAADHFTPADWMCVNDAFSDNADPLFGDQSKKEFDELHSHLVNIVPKPYGLGEVSATR